MWRNPNVETNQEQPLQLVNSHSVNISMAGDGSEMENRPDNVNSFVNSYNTGVFVAEEREDRYRILNN